MAASKPVENRPEDQDISRHEVERMAERLNEWFAHNKKHLPACFDWHTFSRQSYCPLFKPVPTTAIKDWKIEDLNRLFHIVRKPVQTAAHETAVVIELLVADKSLSGQLLNVRTLLKAALDIIANRHMLGRFNPRLWWFWINFPLLIKEIETYVNGIHLRVDAATPIPHNTTRIFEAFSVPLEDGQQTAIGNSCIFILEYAQPQGAVAHWRFSIRQHDQVIVGPQNLKTNPIYYEDRLLAVIKNFDDKAVTLSVLTSGN